MAAAAENQKCALNWSELCLQGGDDEVAEHTILLFACRRMLFLPIEELLPLLPELRVCQLPLCLAHSIGERRECGGLQSGNLLGVFVARVVGNDGFAKSMREVNIFTLTVNFS